MNNKDLKQIVEGLVHKFGYQGASEYISTGEYPYELKTLALSILNQKETNSDSFVANSDYRDVENPWGDSIENLYYAS